MLTLIAPIKAIKIIILGFLSLHDDYTFGLALRGIGFHSGPFVGRGHVLCVVKILDDSFY